MPGVWSKGAALNSLVARPFVEKPQPQNDPRLLSQVNLQAVAPKDYTPQPWQERNNKQFQSANVLNSIIQDRGHFDEAPDPQYDWALKSEKLSSQIARLQASLAAQRAKNAHIRTMNSTVHVPNINFNGGGGGGGGAVGNLGHGRFGDFVRAISGQESGGNYGAVNSSSGALGKYQIMPGNFVGPGGWDREALGRDISAQEFLRSPKLQEAIARHKLHNYYSKYGVRGAASAWYSGDPNKWRNSSPQGGYPSIAAYVASIIRRMGG